MAGVSTTLHPELPASVVVTAIDPDGAGSRLIGSYQGRQIEVTVPAVADPDVARRWLRAVRRVHRVEIRLSGRGVSAVVDGVGYRLPFVRRLPLALALGLGKLGTPVLLRNKPD